MSLYRIDPPGVILTRRRKRKPANQRLLVCECRERKSAPKGDGLAILALLVLCAVVIALVNGWGEGGEVLDYLTFGHEVTCCAMIAAQMKRACECSHPPTSSNPNHGADHDHG